MNLATIEETEQIYRCSRVARIHQYTVVHGEFRSFCKQVQMLEAMLGDAAKDEYWHQVLGSLKRYRFNMMAGLLPFDWRDPAMSGSINEPDRLKNSCAQLYPSVTRQLNTVLASWMRLSCLSDNPLLEKLVDTWTPDPRHKNLVVLKEERLALASRSAIWNCPSLLELGIEVLSPSQIDLSVCYDFTVIVGPVRWFPEHLFDAPRAVDTITLSYRWIADRWQAKHVFAGSSRLVPGIHVDASAGDTTDDANLDPDEILLSVNWNMLTERLAKPDDHGDQYQDVVDSKLVILSGENAVFVEAAAAATQLVLDLDEGNDERSGDCVQRILTGKLKPGLFILLRTEGSGNYIIPVADQLMGQTLANKTRRSQALWKNLLRRSVKQRGLLETCIDLIDLGSPKANEVNVRNWMSTQTIRPGDHHDFHAVLKLIGLDCREEEFIQDAATILNAHQRAGFHIRNQLLTQVNKSDLSDLRKQGSKEFLLPAADGGKLTAFRIEQVAPKSTQVPSSKIGLIITLKDIQWQS